MAGQPRTVRHPGHQAAPSVAGFGWLGAGLVLVGVLALLGGLPSRPRDLLAITDPIDLIRRAGELSLPLSAAATGLAAALVAGLFAARRLSPNVAAVELAVLGVAIEVAGLAAAPNVAYSASGAVLPGAVSWIVGGISIVMAALAASLAAGAREPGGKALDGAPDAGATDGGDRPDFGPRR